MVISTRRILVAENVVVMQSDFLESVEDDDFVRFLIVWPVFYEFNRRFVSR